MRWKHCEHHNHVTCIFMQRWVQVWPRCDICSLISVWIHSLWSCVSPTASCCQVSRWTAWSSLPVGYNYCQWVKCQVVTRLLRANALTDWLLFPQAGRNPFPQVSTQDILQFTKSPEERWGIIHFLPLSQLLWNIGGKDGVTPRG